MLTAANLIALLKSRRPDWSKATAYMEYKDSRGNVIRRPIKVTILIHKKKV